MEADCMDWRVPLSGSHSAIGSHGLSILPADSAATAFVIKFTSDSRQSIRGSGRIRMHRPTAAVEPLGCQRGAKGKSEDYFRAHTSQRPQDSQQANILHMCLVLASRRLRQDQYMI